MDAEEAERRFKEIEAAIPELRMSESEHTRAAAQDLDDIVQFYRALLHDRGRL